MKLLVEELLTELYQEITIGNKNLHIKNIRPYLYIHNAPAGSLKLEVRDSSNKKIAESTTQTIASINTAVSSLGFFHGVIKFDINASLRSGQTYRVALVSSGYTFAETDYIGWNKGFDLGVVDSDYSPSVGVNSAFIMELWNLNTVVKGEIA